MWHLESLFCHVKDVVNAKIPFIYVMYFWNTFHLGIAWELGGHRVIDITNEHFIHAGPLEGTRVSISI